MLAAPELKVAPVVSVGFQCGGGLGCGNEGPRLLDEFFEAGGFRAKRINMGLHGGFPFGMEAHVCRIPGGRN